MNEDEALIKKRSRDRLLGKDYICIQRGEGKDVKEFVAVQGLDAIEVLNKSTSKKLASLPLKGLDTTGNKILVEVNKINTHTYIIALIGIGTSMINPNIEYAEPVAMQEATRYLLRDEGFCLVQIGEHVRNHYSAQADKLYMVYKGRVTELLQFKTLFRDSILIVDEVVTPRIEFRRRIIKTADNSNVVPSNRWSLGYALEKLKIHVATGGVLVASKLEELRSSDAGDKRRSAKGAILIGNEGGVRHRGDVTITFKNDHPNILYKPEIWMGCSLIELRWSGGEPKRGYYATEEIEE